MSVSETDIERSPSLALVHGGRGSTNWLGNLPVKTCFLTREKGTLRFELVMFQILETSVRSTLLLQPNYTGGPGNYIWVDPIKFSHNMEPFEIFPLGQEEDVTRDESEE